MESLESRVLMSSYYVDDIGSDAAAGSPAAPWATLQKAANSVTAGDTVVIMPGNYAGFNLARSGTSSARITFDARAGAVINRPVNIGNSYGINTSGQSYVTLQGFTFAPQPGQGEWYSAIRMAGSPGSWARGNIMRNNTAKMRVVNRDATPDKYGFYSSWQDGIVIENNSTSGGYNTGIYVANSSKNYAVRGNRVSDVGGNGIHNNGDLSAGSPGINSNGVIDSNVISNVGFGIGGQAISCDSVQDSRIVNNLIYDAHAKGISLYVVNGAAGSTRNVVANNTVITAADSTGAGMRLPGGNSGNTIFGNIFLSRNSNGLSYDDEAGGNYYDYNVVTTKSAARDVHGATATAADFGAIFVDYASSNYHLTAGSRAIDRSAGSFNGKSAPSFDSEGDARPQGASFDSGYDEYRSSVTAADTTPPTASSSGSNVTNAGGTTHPFNVTYADNVSVDVTSIDSADVRVTGPNSFSQVATLVNLPYSGNTTPVTATYRISAPGGTWDGADNGTYTVSILASQVKDSSGNFATARSLGTFNVSVAAPNPAPSGSFTQTTAADFSAGTHSGTVVTNTSGGEVSLARLVDDDFNAAPPSASWTSTPYSSGGGATASAGVLAVKATQVRSAATVTGAVEARVEFNAATQGFGIGTDLSNAAGNAWAIFSTKGTATTLYARTNVNGSTQTVSLGTTPIGLHTYRIQPVSGGFAFYVDGALKATITETLPTGSPLKVVMSDIVSPNGIRADWVRTDAYVPSGTFTSSVIDAGASVPLRSASWTAALPAGTSLVVETRVGNSASPDGTWSPWSAVGSGGEITGQSGQYVQYRVTLVSSSIAAATLSDLTLNWG